MIPNIKEGININSKSFETLKFPNEYNIPEINIPSYKEKTIYSTIGIVMDMFLLLTANINPKIKTKFNNNIIIQLFPKKIFNIIDSNIEKFDVKYATNTMTNKPSPIHNKDLDKIFPFIFSFVIGIAPNIFALDIVFFLFLKFWLIIKF